MPREKRGEKKHKIPRTVQYESNRRGNERKNGTPDAPGRTAISRSDFAGRYLRAGATAAGASANSIECRQSRANHPTGVDNFCWRKRT